MLILSGVNRAMIYSLVRDRGEFKVRVRFGNRARLMVG